MNWLQEEDAARWAMDEASDKCTHVEADPTLAHKATSENGSFGCVAVSVLCKECAAASEARDLEEEHECADCTKSVRLRDGRSWAWYDIDYRAGERPLFICHTCWFNEKHQGRVHGDLVAADEEDRRYSDDDSSY